MIPILYEQTEKQFTSGGLGFLADCTSFKVTQERNGIYEAEFTYPITGPLYDQIQENRIVYATHDNSGDPQPFDIYGRSAPINGIVTFYAHHVSYRLSNAVVMPFKATSVADAMSKIESHIVTTDDFTFWTDKTTTGDYEKVVPSIVRTMLGGEEGSLLDVYGRGDYEFDKFAVRLYQNMGRDTDVEIRYGKNLTDLTHKVDNSETYNAIVPYYYNVSELVTTRVTLPEGYVSYDDGRDYIVAVPLDMTKQYSEVPDSIELRQDAQQLLDSSHAWIPSESFEVNFVQLWETEEYKQYAPLQRVNLCDTVRVYYPELGVDAVRERVVKTVYNTLLDRYDEITLNELPTTLTGLTQQQISAETAGSVSAESMAAAINLAVQLVRGGLGGYIAMPADANGLPELIYLLDQPNVDDAVNVIRLGSDGISRSSSGIAGPFSSIISMTGAIRGNVTGNLTGTVFVVLSGTSLAQLVGMVLGSENVAAIKATYPFALVDGSDALGYRYGGSSGAGTYGAPHYFKGNVIIDGDITVTGTINNGGA